MDITKEIQKWQEIGDHVILLTDYNDNITSPLVRRWVANLGLVEAITWLHSDIAPPTYQHGSRPIDGIFASPQLLERAAGGYLSIGKGILSNHHMLWINLHLPEVSPSQQAVHIKPMARRLQCKDPQIMN